MKSVLVFILIGIFLVSSMASISAQDCWWTGQTECKYVEMTACIEGYFDNLPDCNFLLQKKLNPEIVDKNIIQSFAELNFPGYEANEFVKNIYDLENNEIFIYTFVILLIGLSIRNGMKSY